MEDSNLPSDAFVTFIIPTIGRETLPQTLKSLINQTDINWKAIVIFDGISSTIESPDSRIKIIELGKGTNSAGLVRNYGIKFVDTEWIAFVDDDDSVSCNYVNILKNEILEYNDADLIIFRMMLGNSTTILPLLETDTFHGSLVGISFAVKKKLFEEGHLFEPSPGEDYYYLDGARTKNYKIMISPHITYFVRNYEQNLNDKKGNRVFINF